MDGLKNEDQLLYEKLAYIRSSAWEGTNEKEVESVFDFCDGYKKFLDITKTERKFASEAEKIALENGFIGLDDAVRSGRLYPGMKVFQVVSKKSVLLAVLGTDPIEQGINVIGTHSDAPRLDLKQNPIYEDGGMVLLKSHYYGGVKKYQWVGIPLAIHGVIVKRNGETVEIELGEEDSDAVFVISDLLPHLANEQMESKMSEAVKGENLNVLAGNIPYHNASSIKEKVKLNILELLHKKYGIIEEDFQSAELEVVPAFKARDVGFDRSMLGAYGQDDRICSYAALQAMLCLAEPRRTAVLMIADKEEIGNIGNASAGSNMLEDFIAYLCAYSADGYNDIFLRKCLRNSRMLSGDVNAAFDPNYETAFDKYNSVYIGRGVMLQKYNGERGKFFGHDASAEFLGEIRQLFNKNNIRYQTGELGKVDQGGGYTLSNYGAAIGMDVVDCGVALLSMHAPFEITSKIDVYTAFRAYKAFYAGGD